MKLLQQLAEQYAPGQTTVRKEQEASEELKTLYGKRLSNEREYQIASLAQQQENMRQRLKAETDAKQLEYSNRKAQMTLSPEAYDQMVAEQQIRESFHQRRLQLDKEVADKNPSNMCNRQTFSRVNSNANWILFAMPNRKSGD